MSLQYESKEIVRSHVYCKGTQLEPRASLYAVRRYLLGSVRRKPN